MRALTFLSVATAFVLLAGCGSSSRGGTAKGAEVQVAATPLAVDASRDAAIAAKLPPGTKPYREVSPQGAVLATGFLCDGQPIGPWIYCHPNGRRRYEGTFLYGGLRDGAWSFWYENGFRRSEGHYRRGKEHGAWQFWHENGAPSAAGAFADGKRSGLWQTSHENGARASAGRFVAGTANGAWMYWDTNGNPADSTQVRALEVVGQPF